MAKLQKGSTLINIVFVLILFSLIGFGLYKFYWPDLSMQISPKTYDECTKAPGSILQESYPAVCVAKSGARFTQPLTQEEKDKLNMEVNAANLKTYTNPKAGYSFSYPEDFDLTDAGSQFIPPYFMDNPGITLSKAGFHDETAQYSQTADFSVSTSDDIKNCYKFESNTISDILNINGVAFKTTKTSGAATGHTIDATLYRTIRGKTCFEIATSVQSQTGSGEGLDVLQNTILLDQQKLQSGLDQILSTFIFNE